MFISIIWRPFESGSRFDVSTMGGSKYRFFISWRDLDLGLDMCNLDDLVTLDPLRI